MDLVDAAKSWIVASGEMGLIGYQGRCRRGSEAATEEVRCSVLYDPPEKSDVQMLAGAACTKQIC